MNGLQTGRQGSHVTRAVQRQEGHIVGTRSNAPMKWDDHLHVEHNSLWLMQWYFVQTKFYISTMCVSASHSKLLNNIN